MYFSKLLTPLLYLSLLLGWQPVQSSESTEGGSATDSPESKARSVLQRQLTALQNNDEPEPDAGIKTAWDHAHPANRAHTGPYERFKNMLKGPVYGGLIDHEKHKIKLMQKTKNSATYNVIAIPEENQTRLLYRWKVEKILKGNRAGEWATTAVSAPIEKEQIQENRRNESVRL